MRLLVAVLAVLAFPPPAGALPSIVGRDVSLHGDPRSLASAPVRFNLVGLHWQGPGTVELRTRAVSGRWSAWREAAPEDEDRPEAGTGEGTGSGWRLGNPYWTGASNRLEVRVRGRVSRVRAWYVWSPPGAAPQRSLAAAGAPPIVTRAGWKANELIRRAAPSYATSLAFAVVHHTAGSNTYTREQSAAIVRAIQTYHVQANGWNDVGYNFLVDKYGQVFEGRYGGIERNVVGAHAEGFNTGSVGVALLGTYGGATVTPAARAALTRLLAWRLDVAHVDPLTTLSWTSGGNPRFPRGVPVFLRAIAGHRDTGFTDCPGARLYAQLDPLARAVAATGLPKLYAPSVRGALGGPVRFTARLSASAPWTVTITDAAGRTVATGTGTGATVDWTWDATAAAGAYGWTIATAGARPAAGALGRTGVLAVTRVRAEPAAVSPNGDGVDDATTISYVLGTAATVTATLVDASGATVATLFSEPRAAGEQSFTLTAENVADGAYTVVISAAGGNGRTATGRVPVLVSRTLSAFRAARAAFSPNGDRRADTLPFTFALAQPAIVRLRILRDGRWVATPAPAAPLEPGPHALLWDGTKRLGRPPEGLYQAELTVTDAAGTVRQLVTFAVDTTAPSLRLLSRSPRVRIRLSEAADVLVVADGARTVVRKRGAGIVVLPLAARAVRAVAYDTAGNKSRVLSVR